MIRSAVNKSMYAFVNLCVYVLQASEGHFLPSRVCFEAFPAFSPLHFVTRSSSGYDLAPLGGLWGPLAKLVSAAPGTGVAGP